MNEFDWAVIGAGPAGIAAVGKLLDANIQREKILWIDPEFCVGDIGKFWYEVPSNTKIKSFMHFLQGCKSFHFKKSPDHFAIKALDDEDHCELGVVVEALLWITAEVRQQVISHQGFVKKIRYKNNMWEIFTDNENFSANKVILSTGSDAKVLDYEHEVISLQHALNPKKIKDYFSPDDTIGVVGSSHSAVLIIKNFLDAGAKKVLNYYRSPFLYAVYFDDCILFDSTGLKGKAADWTREFLEKNHPKNLQRIELKENSLDEELKTCDKVVYAIGFEGRKFPVIESDVHYDYLKSGGMLAPNLFGLGIAYPEALRNPVKVYEYRVGLSKFIDYLNRIMPVWLGE